MTRADGLTVRVDDLLEQRERPAEVASATVKVTQDLDPEEGVDVAPS